MRRFFVSVLLFAGLALQAGRPITMVVRVDGSLAITAGRLQAGAINTVTLTPGTGVTWPIGVVRVTIKPPFQWVPPLPEWCAIGDSFAVSGANLVGDVDLTATTIRTWCGTKPRQVYVEVHADTGDFPLAGTEILVYPTATYEDDVAATAVPARSYTDAQIDSMTLRPSVDGEALADANRFAVGQNIDGTWTWCAKTGTQLLAWVRAGLGAASTSQVGLSPQATAPAAGMRSALAIDNGETARTDKALFDATPPAALASAAATGSAMAAARRDHVHALPSPAGLAVLGLDQTTPQTVANGIPVFGAGIKVDNAQIRGIGTNNITLNAGTNVMDATVASSVIGGGGSNAAPNKIGMLNGLPYYSGLTPTDWSADTAYVAGVANIAVICGGYDNVLNQEAGCIVGGGHNFIKSNPESHAFIGGGSYNLISGGRSSIVGGQANTITGAGTTGSGILGGADCNIVGDYSSIVGGYDHDINGAQSAILGGTACSVTGDVSLAFGSRVKISADGVVAFADTAAADLAATAANTFYTRFAGGYSLYGSSLRLLTTDYVFGSVGTSLQLSSSVGTGNGYNLIQSMNAGAGAWANLTIKAALVGINTTSPLRALDINKADGNCLRLIHNDGDGSATNYADFLVSSTGRLNISPSGGNIGIAQASPSARLHLPAGAAGAETAPLLIPAGTVNTTPVSGCIESDGTHLYWVDSGGNRKQLDN